MRGQFETGDMCLVHHTDESRKGSISPFHTALESIIDRSDVRIACPYLSVQYLMAMTELARSWRLLTDVEEWLSSQSTDLRTEAEKFIRDNQRRIRHCPSLHAKIAMNEEVALIGSANFTRRGLTSREEIGVIVRGATIVGQLHAWFDQMWDQTTQADLAELATYVTGLPTVDPDARATDHKIRSPFKPPRAKLPPLGKARADSEPSPSIDKKVYSRLLKYLRMAPDRRWIEGYFDLVREVIETSGLSSDDDRLVMTIRTSRRLPVTINQRYVLAALWKDRSSVGFSLSKEYPIPDILLDRKLYEEEGYEPRKKEPPAEVPRYVEFKLDHPSDVPADLKRVWKEVISREVGHGEGSSHRRYHQPLIYAMAMNPAVRRRVFDDAFGS